MNSIGDGPMPHLPLDPGDSDQSNERAKPGPLWMSRKGQPSLRPLFCCKMGHVEGGVAMRIRLRDWRAWFIDIAVGVAVAYVAWPTRKVPVPEIPRPGPSAFTEREVQMDVAGAARRVE